MFVGLVSASLALVPAAGARSEPVRDTGAVIVDSPADSASREAAAPGLAPEDERTNASRGNFATVFLSDLGHVVTAPARMNRRAALWTALVAGGAAILYANDAELHDAARRARGNPLYDALVEDLGDFIEPVGNMGNTNVFYAAGWVAGHAFKVRGLQVIPFQILESHAISGGIRNLAELSVGRFRPSAGRGPRHFESGNGTSFPSGHASVAFELATILSHHARWQPVTVASYGLATVMAVQRVDSDSHWPSDVFVAAVTGHVIARTIVARQDQRERGPRVGLAPWPGGLRIAVAF